jgi:hypothetical protein
VGSDNIENLRDRVKDGITKLKGLEIGDEFAVEILAQLVEGKKTVAEIVEAVYGLRNSDEGYLPIYAKVWRQIRQLESKGLVSTRILGRNKPYRLTQLAIINLAKIGGEEQQVPVIPRVDLVPYVGTLVIAGIAILQARDILQFTETTTMGLLLLFGLFAGVSLCRSIETIRRVF